MKSMMGWKKRKVNIDIAQCVMIFCFGFFSVLNSVKAAKAIQALQRETDGLWNQLNCLEENCEYLREKLYEVEKFICSM